MTEGVKTSHSGAAAFASFHPVVPFVYFAAFLVLQMLAINPVLVGISYAGALSLHTVLRGWRASARMLAWQLPVVAVVAAFNFVLSENGFTEAFRIGTRAFYWESAAFGVTMGVLLASVLTSFANAGAVIDSSKVTELFGRVAPTISLMISMTMRLVVQFMRRGRTIMQAQAACTAAGGSGSRLRDVTVLMGWGLEDSLDTVATMRARGWASGVRRTNYQRYRFGAADGLVCAALAAIVAGALAALLVAHGGFHFYPTIGGLAPWWAFTPQALLAAFPLALEVKERLAWMR